MHAHILSWAKSWTVCGRPWEPRWFLWRSQDWWDSREPDLSPVFSDGFVTYFFQNMGPIQNINIFKVRHQ